MVQIRWEGFGGNLVHLQGQLERLLEDSSGRAIVLMDSAGRLLTMVGDAPRFDLTTFVSLMAADFCATRELARLLGEETFHTVYHQGEEASLYLTQATEGTLLAVIFDRQTTLGLVRYAVRRALPALGDTVREGCREGSGVHVRMAEGFGAEAASRLDELFGAGA